MSTSNIDAGCADNDDEEQWRAHPEGTDVGAVPAFGLYFLRRIPAGECFDGSASVGVSVPPPYENQEQHFPDVVLGYTGDSGAQLTNWLLRPDDARRLAKLLKKAAKKADR